MSVSKVIMAKVIETLHSRKIIVGANLFACPHCGANARRRHPSWWQRLISRKPFHYHCYTCGKHFATK